MALSDEERKILDAIEARLIEDDPWLADALATFARPVRARWLRTAVVTLLLIGALGLLMGTIARLIVGWSAPVPASVFTRSEATRSETAAAVSSSQCVAL